jgi:hypothetical protein
VLSAGAVIQVVAGRAAGRPGNAGDALVLVDAAGVTVDRVGYAADRVTAGRTICFGR